MKFLSESKFWRERGNCCTFIERIEVISDDGKTAELKVSWCHQLNKGWRKIGKEHIRIRERDYPNWMTYFPRGDEANEI